MLLSIFQFIGDTPLFSVTILKQSYKRKKTIFEISFYFDVITRQYFIKVIRGTNFNFIPSLKFEILKEDLNTCMHVCLLYIATRQKLYNRRVNRINQ